MFGERLKEVRKERGYTLEELSNAYNKEFGAGLNKGTLSKYENNKQEPMISVVNNLSTILNVKVDYLLGKTDSYFKLTDKQNKNAFARNLDFYINKKEITKDKLIKDLGFSAKEFEGWYSGTKNPSLKEVNIICSYLGIKTSELLLERNELIYNDEIYDLALEISDNPDLFILLETARKLPSDKIKAYIEFMLKMTDK